MIDLQSFFYFIFPLLLPMFIDFINQGREWFVEISG
jgi:hypothetical protein